MARIRIAATETLLHVLSIILIVNNRFLLMANANASETLSPLDAFLYQSFNGAIGEASSWFDPSRWTESGEIPTTNDSVWLDQPNTYVAIDETSENAWVDQLVVGRSASSNALTSVQLDVLQGAKLNVTSNMNIGFLVGSEGTVYAGDSSEIDIGGTLSVGSGEGSGMLFLQGTARVVVNDLVIGGDNSPNSGSLVILDDAAKLKVKGSLKINMVSRMITDGLIVAASKGKVGAPAKTFDVRKANGYTVVTLVDESDCQDRDDLKFQNKSKKTCRWVGKKKTSNRCNKDWEGGKLSDWCPVTCETCDNPDCQDGILVYDNGGGDFKNCTWVDDAWTPKRCNRMMPDGNYISSVCKKTCGTC